MMNTSQAIPRSLEGAVVACQAMALNAAEGIEDARQLQAAYARDRYKAALRLVELVGTQRAAELLGIARSGLYRLLSEGSKR